MWLPSFNTGVGRSHSHAGSRLQHLGQRMKLELFGQPAARCSICHAELAPDERVDGLCRDQESCCLRRYSHRCF